MALGRNPLAQGFEGAPREQANAPLTVSAAVGTAKACVNGLGSLLVSGEVTGFRGPNARSGHCYFQIKDDLSSMDVIVWRHTYSHLNAQLKDGLVVVLRGKFDVYKGTGRLSFIADSVEMTGEGLLRQQVAALARKLEAEGLMAPERKRRIPAFCTRVAVVTSLSGSVIDDVKRTLRRRNPLVELDVVGCAVQGPGAPATIMRALQVAAQAAPEAILLVRGGGSFEDLMTFNDEALARTVAASPVPVITGIGHEPDTSICDMVSDRRCSTPTAAAESVAPALGDIVSTNEMRRQRLCAAMARICSEQGIRVDSLSDRAQKAMDARLSHERVMLNNLAQRRCLQNPMGFVEERAVHLLQSEQRLHDAMPRVIERAKRDVRNSAQRLDVAGEGMLRPYEASLGRMAASLEALSPLKVLSRGYAITRDGEGHVVSDATQVRIGENVSILMDKGTLDAQVTAVHE